MEGKEMIERLHDIVRQYADEETTITAEMTLLTHLGLNSYELVQLVCEIEEEFGVEIPDRTISGFKTMQDVMNYLVAQ